MAYLFLNSAVENKSSEFYTNSVPLSLPVAVAAECMTTRILKNTATVFQTSTELFTVVSVLPDR